MTDGERSRQPEDETPDVGSIDEDAPARGVLDEQDPNPPEPNEPA